VLSRDSRCLGTTVGNPSLAAIAGLLIHMPISTMQAGK
jgi:hypothetical protein